MRYQVTETKTITITHIIEAANKKDAIARMQYNDSSKGQIFLDILEDDSDVEYEVEEYD